MPHRSSAANRRRSRPRPFPSAPLTGPQGFAGRLLRSEDIVARRGAPLTPRQRLETALTRQHRRLTPTATRGRRRQLAPAATATPTARPAGSPFGFFDVDEILRNAR